MIPVLLVAFALAILLGTGCGEQNAKLSPAQSKVFDSAPPEVKAVWEKALAADAATNYVDTLTLLNNLKGMQLTDEQRDALNKEFTDFGQRLWSAAAKKDPSAVQAVQTMRMRQPAQ